MLFVGLLKAKSGTLAERTAHRAQWQYPAGARPIGEYWLQSGEIAVVSVFEADSFDPIMAISGEWSDEFDITIVPAITGEDGLKWVKQHMGGNK